MDFPYGINDDDWYIPDDEREDGGHPQPTAEE